MTLIDWPPFGSIWVAVTLGQLPVWSFCPFYRSYAISIQRPPGTRRRCDWSSSHGKKEVPSSHLQYLRKPILVRPEFTHLNQPNAVSPQVCEYLRAKHNNTDLFLRRHSKAYFELLENHIFDHWPPQACWPEGLCLGVLSTLSDGSRPWLRLNIPTYSSRSFQGVFDNSTSGKAITPIYNSWQSCIGSEILLATVRSLWPSSWCPIWLDLSTKSFSQNCGCLSIFSNTCAGPVQLGN